MPRPALPSAIHRQRGTEQPCRANPTEPAYQVGAPDMPQAVALNALAVAAWREVTPTLVANGVLTRVDVGVLVNYALARAVVIGMQTILDAEGYVVASADDGGIARKHPAWSIQREAMAMVITASNELGLTPAARRKVDAKPPATTDSILDD